MQLPGLERDSAGHRPDPAREGRRYGRRVRLAVHGITATVALALPILAMLALAIAQGYAVTQQKLEAATAEMLRRVDRNLAEARQSIGEAERRGAGIPVCSLWHINEMSKIAAGYSYIGGIGHIEGNRLGCSSFSFDPYQLDLGEAGTTIGDSRWWSNASIPGVSAVRYNIYASGQYAAIYPPDLAVDIGTAEELPFLAHVQMTTRSLVRARGTIAAGWLAVDLTQPHAFMDESHLVFVQPSADARTAALAAVPLAEVGTNVRDMIRHYLAPAIALGLAAAFVTFLGLRYFMSLKRELRLALRRGEFFLVYQPVVDLVTGQCLGAEALIRWRRRDGRMISPADFIPAAERHGLIGAVTARVLDLVAADAPAFLRHSPKAHIAINLSAFDLQDAGILARLDALIASLEASSDNIIVEATEHSFLAPERALPNLKSIRSSGFRIAIDDFGTGASSLSMIRVYELDYLKIDRSFLADIRDGECTPVLFHIAGLAHSLGLQIIAEGVETEAQRQALIRLGVQYAQGWLFGKPMPMPALCDYARRREVAVT